MIDFLIKKFVKNSGDVTNQHVRTAYGMLSGSVGIAVNALLAGVKILIGTITNSIAITADGINNLSDAGSSGVTLFGFRAAGRPADDEHPYGHGRLEYVCALIVAFLVLLMGVELVKSSITRIRQPEPVEFSIAAVLVLLASIGGKIWLALFYKKIGGLISSQTVNAVVVDSISDTAATAVSMLALVLSNFTALPLDGYFGIVVALFIFYAGIGILKDTVSELLGVAPDAQTVEQIRDIIMSHDGVVGVHDFMLHSYGPGRVFGSAHAEVPSNIDIMKSHDTIDNIERDILGELGILFVIHLDPIIVDDEQINKTQTLVLEAVHSIDAALSIHDFRMVDGETHTNLIFDVVVPHGFELSKLEVAERVEKAVKKINSRYYAVVTVENTYI